MPASVYIVNEKKDKGMKKIASFLLLILVFSLQVHAQKRIQVNKFEKNVTSLIGSVNQVEDNAGEACAVLRVWMPDDDFEVEPNLGVLRRETKTGELLLWIPVGTKRLTIRHNGVMPLAGYVIPFKLEPKVTYDAELEIVESWKERDRNNKKRDYHVYLGAGYNVMSVSGPSATLGLNYRGFAVEGGFVFGIDKVENITLTLQGSSALAEAYDYTSMKAWARVGYQIKAAEHFFITPMAGATFNMISGKSTLSSASTNYFKESNPMSIHAAVRFSYEVIDHLYLHLTPQYDFSLNNDQIFEVIKHADNKLKAWVEGFGINAGFIYEF